MTLKKNSDLDILFNQFKEEYSLIETLVSKRKELGLTQKEVAIRSGLSQQTISRIETLNGFPTLHNLISYINALGLVLTINDK